MQFRLKRSLTQGTFIAVTVFSLALAACGANAGSSSAVNKSLIIGTDFPTSGTDASLGKPTEQGVDLAVSQASLPNGYTLSVLNKNDEGTSGADPTIGAQNINDLIANSQVVAVVGPFNSGVAVSEIPLVNTVGLVEISPSNTNPGLTKQQYAAQNNINFSQLHPAGKAEAYFRIPATDEVQGKVNGDLAIQLGAKSAYVIDDKSVYGIGLATQFKLEFQAKGGTIAGTAEITPDQVSSFPSLAQQIISTKPDLVFYGGVTSQGGAALKGDLTKAGAGALPFVGGDGIADDPGFLTAATPQGANNTFGTIPAPDLSGLTSAAGQKFISDFKAKYGTDPVPYSAMSYDAANLEIAAITKVINSGAAVTRANVLAQVAGITYTGLTGTIKFDANGDNSGGALYSVYEVVNGAWVFKQTVNVGA